MKGPPLKKPNGNLKDDTQGGEYGTGDSVGELDLCPRSYYRLSCHFPISKHQSPFILHVYCFKQVGPSVNDVSRGDTAATIDFDALSKEQVLDRIPFMTKDQFVLAVHSGKVKRTKAWDDSEITLFAILQQSFGSKWTELSKQVPTR